VKKDGRHKKPAEEEELGEAMAGIEVEGSNPQGEDRDTEDEKDPSVLFGVLLHEGDHPDQEVTDPNCEIHSDGPEEAVGTKYTGLHRHTHSPSLSQHRVVKLRAKGRFSDDFLDLG